MWTPRISRARWEVEAEIVVGEKIAAAAHQTGYLVSMRTLKPVPIPVELRRKWEGEAGRLAELE
jgi:acyl-CoA thioester hydrolase